jgi:hypothetical protein
MTIVLPTGALNVKASFWSLKKKVENKNVVAQENKINWLRL